MPRIKLDAVGKYTNKARYYHGLDSPKNISWDKKWALDDSLFGKYKEQQKRDREGKSVNQGYQCGQPDLMATGKTLGNCIANSHHLLVVSCAQEPLSQFLALSACSVLLGTDMVSADRIWRQGGHAVAMGGTLTSSTLQSCGEDRPSENNLTSTMTETRLEHKEEGPNMRGLFKEVA